MPYRAKKPKRFIKTKKRGGRRRQRRGQASSGIPYRMTSRNEPFPHLYKTILRYQQTIELNSVAGEVVHKEFSTNGLYDPYILAGGGQPKPRDELMNIYNKYHVIGSRITVTYSTIGQGASNDAVVCGISKRPLNYSGIGIDYRDYMEDGKSVWKATAAGIDVPKLKMTWSPKKDEGVVDVLSHGAWGGTSADVSNPTNGAQFIVWLGPVDKATNIGGWNALVFIEYIAVFSSPKHLTAS